MGPAPAWCRDHVMSVATDIAARRGPAGRDRLGIERSVSGDHPSRPERGQRQPMFQSLDSGGGAPSASRGAPDLSDILATAEQLEQVHGNRPRDERPGAAGPERPPPGYHTRVPPRILVSANGDTEIERPPLEATCRENAGTFAGPAVRLRGRGPPGARAARLTGCFSSSLFRGCLFVNRYVRMYVPSMFAVLPLVPVESVLLMVLATVKGSKLTVQPPPM